ncbi:MAG: ATP-dependent zinc metalloprotease FtsH [Dongiaceae bacterium]
MNQNARNIMLWIIIGLMIFGLFNLYDASRNKPVNNWAFSEFIEKVEKNEVAEVTIRGSIISGHTTTNVPFSTYSPYDPNMVDRLTKAGVKITAGPPEENVGGVWGVLLSWFPMLLFIGVWVFFMRQMQSGAGKAMGFGKSRARLLNENKSKVTFEDVAGIDEAKAELQEIVEFLKDPGKFQRLGGKIPKGVLLVGPPGTGKTLLARSIAGEANVPFFSISGSDFVEMFVGVGASRVRDMFEQGKKNAPCIIFIDEIDAVGRHRGFGLGGGNDEREQTLNQMLVEMDGFESNEGVIIVAATNRPDVLDPALLRPGRFDRQVVVPNPDVKGREQIISVHLRKVPQGPDVDPKTIARGTPGFSGADLANLVNEAALMAARKGKRYVTMAELEAAKDKVMMGSERRSLVMSDEEKKLTAYHEAGHAIVAIHCPESDPVHKATIIPRGRALGMVMRLPEGDRLSTSKAKLKADLAVAMGGRIAEELIFGAEKVTTGASSDIKMATDMARRMVTEWGMSDKLGFMSYSGGDQEVYLGHSVNGPKPMSEETAKTVDQEARFLIDTAYKHAMDILTANKHELEALARGLLDYETLSGDEINTLLKGDPLNRDRASNSDRPAGSRKSAIPSSGPRLEPKPQI